MNITVFSHKFHPDLGGIETMSALLAKDFAARGNSVTLVTHSVIGESDPSPDSERTYEVLRRPSASALMRAVRNSDVVFHNNICLQFAWPLALYRRPWVIAVRTWIRRNDGSLSVRDRVKHLLLKTARVISISPAIADHLRTQSVVIPNAYRDGVFRITQGVERTRGSLVFVGRLVPSKGASVLLRAIGRLAIEGLRIPVTIVGSGPEEQSLRTLAKDLGIESIVEFSGPRTAPELVEILNRHDIMVVPSVWDEPFGIVALEGMACGCVPIVSEGGGLGGAVGDAGVTVRNGDEADLSDAIRRLVHDDEEMSRLRGLAPGHLLKHTAATMADSYFEEISKAVRA
ncbi:glycosyltransferase involved in cell wall biosynthesis [Leifsonia sp. AK011]|uniref:glycosyltransferase family 4 protein n=1 Tax=Leifsonia sp. AK011 TaxID=2723075 RepID=UPI0015C7FA0F|nr:glycosyltransferase family 4 protein [Leifsonia sp. AK011]NYF11673.1 glycosyltransferase involved in cell wall biosynthesis [Leifsonia sp. AK011]